MSPIAINIVVEDLLGETILRKIIPSFISLPFHISAAYGHQGYGYIKKNLIGFNDASKGCPHFVLTDLDQNRCAATLLNDWLPKQKNQNLIFRVAVREVESWILSHRKAFSKFLGISEILVPSNPENLPDPKLKLIQLAKRSKNRRLKDAIIPAKNSTAKVGPDYNGVLSEFITNYWKPDIAAQNSPSLLKACNAIKNFKPKYL